MTHTVDVRLELAAAPHVKGPDSTQRIMWTVTATLLPLVAAASWFFGLAALLVVAAAAGGALLVERLFGQGGSLRDGSALITGLLVGLTVPANLPLWMAFLGGAFAIGIGKLVFGGLGQNVFNPALIGRGFLQAAFPTAITAWPPVAERWLTVYSSNFAAPFMQTRSIDLVTAATPLGAFKFEHTYTPVARLFLGDVGGSLGETSALLILLGGLFLAYKRYLQWRIPASILLTAGGLALLLHTLDAQLYPGPLFMWFSGGLMLGAFYMATDPVTSPITHKGAWIFGCGIGLLTVLIRIWGGLPEGVMYAILLMNALVPGINRVTQPAVFGTRQRSKAAA